MGRGQQIIHEALRHELAFFVVGEFLIERGADAVGDAAHGHAAHDLRIDDGAAVMTDVVAFDVRFAEVGIDRHQQQMELEGEARIHLHAAVGARQPSPCRHLHQVGKGEAGLSVGRQAVEVAMRDGHELGPAAPVDFVGG